MANYSRVEIKTIYITINLPCLICLIGAFHLFDAKIKYTSYKSVINYLSNNILIFWMIDFGNFSNFQHLKSL